MRKNSGAVRVGVIGGSGYAGGELLRLLLGHPQVEIAWVSSRGDQKLERTHRNLAGAGLGFCREEEAGPCDVVFLCVPATVAMKYVPRFLDKKVCVIDMSADFRLRDRQTYERVYGSEHTAFQLMEQAVLGIPELYREELRRARLIANPGCFAITAILGLALGRDGFALGGSGRAGDRAQLPQDHGAPRLVDAEGRAGRRPVA